MGKFADGSDGSDPRAGLIPGRAKGRKENNGESKANCVHSTPSKKLSKYAWNPISGYFREEVQQRIWGKGLPLEGPIGSYLVKDSH